MFSIYYSLFELIVDSLFSQQNRLKSVVLPFLNLVLETYSMQFVSHWKIFEPYFLSIHLQGENVICFWQLQFGLWHTSCNFNTVQSLFKSQQALLLIADRCPCLQFPFPIKSSPLVIYLVKTWDLFRPQILQVPVIISSGFLVLGFTFSYKFWFNVRLKWRPLRQKFCFLFEFSYLIKIRIFRRSRGFNINTFLLSSFEKKIKMIFMFIRTIFPLKDYQV